MSITIGVTTYNRPGYVKKMRQSLYASRGLDRCHIRVYDDCSNEFTIEDLRILFPDAKEIVRRERNLGSDQNIRQMFVDFLQTGDDLLVAADSDLLFRPDWIDFVLENFKYTDGMLGLYNSLLHLSSGKEVVINANEFIEKKHTGSAGVVMSKEIVREIVENIPPMAGYDWAWSKYLRKSGKRLLVSKRSYVQHIGLRGYNCDGFKTTEFGLYFYPGNQINEQFLIEFFQEFIVGVGTLIRQETLDIKISKFTVSPIKIIKRSRKTLKRLMKRKIKKPIKRLIKRLVKKPVKRLRLKKRKIRR